jgi:hypothetical protein
MFANNYYSLLTDTAGLWTHSLAGSILLKVHWSSLKLKTVHLSSSHRLCSKYGVFNRCLYTEICITQEETELKGQNQFLVARLFWTNHSTSLWIQQTGQACKLDNRHGFESWLCPLLTMWPLLSFSFLNIKWG